MFLKVHLRRILPLYNGSLVDRLRYCVAWLDPVLTSFCTTHPPPSSPRQLPSCGNLIRARRAVIRPARRRHRHSSGASSRHSDCFARAGCSLRLHAAPGQGVASIPSMSPSQSWRLTCLNYSQSPRFKVRCCTPHPPAPCARRTNEQVSWMGLALNNSPRLPPHARSRMSGASSPQPVSGCALLLPRPKISPQHQILG